MTGVLLCAILLFAVDMSDCGSPGGIRSESLPLAREAASDLDSDEEVDERVLPRGSAALDDSDDDGDDDDDNSESEDDQPLSKKPVAPKPVASKPARLAGVGDDDDNDDDGDNDDEDEGGDDDDEEERQVTNSVHALSKAFDIATISEDYFLTYGKKTFGAAEYAFVILGQPFACDDGKDMGHILASKSPEEWAKVKSKHIYVLNADGHDYMYVSFFVPGSPTEAIDRRRLQPVHRPVCKGLVERFNNSNISDARRVEIERIMNFECPPDECGPQINPLAMRWKRYAVEAASVPTAKEARQSKPRALKSKQGKVASEPLQAPGTLRHFVQPKGKKGVAAGSGSNDAHASRPKPMQPPAAKRAISEASPRDDGSNASTTAIGSSSAQMPPGGIAGINWIDFKGKDWRNDDMPFKRLRTVEVSNPAKTHVFIMGNEVFIQEHA